MSDNDREFEEESTSIVKVEDMTLDENQLAEQLYHSAGLDPIIEAGMKDYDKKIQQENKLINKVFGIRESDIKGYSEAVAKRVAFAVYSLLNKQYGGKVGDMRSYIMSLEDERSRANTRYDDLMGRVIGILGDEYKDLRTDSREFMEKLTKTLGEDLKDSKIDQTALAERLADIDGLRSQINNLQDEQQKITEKYESQLKELKSDHKEEVKGLQSQIATLNAEKEKIRESYESKLSAQEKEHNDQVEELNSQIADLTSRVAGLTDELKKLTTAHTELRNAIKELATALPGEGTGTNLSGSLYEFILEDSKVPDMVVDGVGKFINFKKYLGEAVERGVQEACDRYEKLLATYK